METKTPIFKRVPPGDRWIELDGNLDHIFASLTDALEHYFQKTKTRQYYIDAGAGIIFKVTEEAEPEPIIQRFSLYDDGF